MSVKWHFIQKQLQKSKLSSRQTQQNYTYNANTDHQASLVYNTQKANHRSHHSITYFKHLLYFMVHVLGVTYIGGVCLERAQIKKFLS